VQLAGSLWLPVVLWEEGPLAVGFAHLDAAGGKRPLPHHVLNTFARSQKTERLLLKNFCGQPISRRKCQMGNYTLEEVIKRWTRGDITTEQVVGQTLLIVQDIARRVGTLEKLREEDRNGGKVEKKGTEE
jgi:hypothetical protein